MIKADLVPMKTFTARERKIFQHIGEGLSSKEIARRLNISLYTVHAHRRNIGLKLGTRSSAELISLAAKMSLSLQNN